MLGTIGALVAARIRRRGLATAISVTAVLAAVALIVTLAGIGAIATERSLERALSAGGPDRPVVRASHFSASSRDLAAVTEQARAALADLEAFSGPVVRAVLIRELVDLDQPIFELIVGIDEPEPWTTLLAGRLPAPCTIERCEALLASEVDGPPGYDTARPAAALSLPIVGRGLLDPAVPFENLDQAGPVGERPALDYQTDQRRPAILLVNGVDGLASQPSLDRTARTYVWTAPLRAGAIHAWTAGDFDISSASAGRRLSENDRAFTYTTPAGRIADEIARAAAAQGRLLLIGSFAVAILLAFVAFAAIVGRTDVAAESARLQAQGARRRDLGTFVVLEALAPVVAGGMIGWPVGIAVTAAIAAALGAPVGPLVSHALVALAPVVAALGVLVLAFTATLAAYAPAGIRPGLVRAVGVAAVTTVALVGWQLTGSGSVDPTALGRSIASPVIVVLPPALAFVVALVFLTILPRGLRAAAHRFRRAPLAVRLSLLSVAREPVRPAALLTLLAFSLGAIVFAFGWSTSLRQGIEDQAAYRAGLDLRISELGTDLSVSQSVVPVDRYDTLGPDVMAVPVFRGTADVGAGAVAVLALPPAALPKLPGWRSEFSDRSIGELAAALDLPAPTGGWQQAGHRLPPDEPELVIRFEYAGEALNLAAIVATNHGDHARIPLGQLAQGMRSVHARLPASAVGGTLIALEFTHTRLIYANHTGEMRRATVSFDGLDGLVDREPIDVEIFSVAKVVVRAPQVTDGMSLPAIVSPDVAAAVDPDGLVRLGIGDGSTLAVRVAGMASAFPTVVEPTPRFAVVPLEPWLLALNAAAPAAGRPTEMWLAVADPERSAAIRTSLAGEPFRFPTIIDRAALTAERAGDPLSQSITWALLVAGLAGLVLAAAGVVLGAAVDLRDERGELADLEAQGVPPSGLRRHVLARSAWLLLCGGLAGLAVGVVLTVFATAALALSAEGALPIPPLRIVIPMGLLVAVVVSICAVVSAVVAWLAIRWYREPPAPTHRPATEPSSGSLPSGSKAIDG